MTKIMEDLYQMLDEQIHIEQEAMEHFKALAKAKLAVLEEIETAGGKTCIPLWDVLGSLDGQIEELRRRALFQAAVKLGMELGRMNAGCPGPSF